MRYLASQQVLRVSIGLIVCLVFLDSVSPGAAKTYVVNNSSNSITVFDLQSNSAAAAIPVGSGPTEIVFASSNRFAYVPNEGSNNVSVIDLGLQATVATIPVGMAPVAVQFSQNDRFGYVANSGSNDLYVLDTAHNSVLTTLPLGLTPVSVNLSPNGLDLFVANQDSNNVTVVNTADNSVRTTIPVGKAPNQVGLTPDGRQALAINTGSNTVTVINTSTLSVARTISVGVNPTGLAVSPDGQFAYVTNRGGNTVSKIQLASGQVTMTFDTGMGPVGIALTGDGRYAFVSNSGSNDVSVLDTTDPANNDIVAVGQSPFSVALDPDENFLYVTNLNSRSVTVIDANSDKVLKTVGVGNSPVQFSLLNAPTLLGISRDLGPSSGGTQLQVIGIGFVQGATVDIGGSPATVTSFSPYALQVSTGRHAPGTVTVNVLNPDQASDSLPMAFTYSGSVQYQMNYPSTLDTASFRTNLGINNLSQSTTIASVSLVDVSGHVLGTQLFPVLSGGFSQVNNVNRSLLGATGSTNSTGSLVVTASKPISGFASIIDNASQDPSLEMATTLGDSHLLIPSVTNSGKFRSNLVIKNLASQTANVKLTARDVSGNVTGARNNLSIPPNGSFETEDILTFMGVAGNFGPLEILAGSGAVLAATSRVYSSDPGGGTNGGFLAGQSFSEANKVLFIPFVNDTADFRMNLGLNNPGAISTRVNVLFYDGAGDLQASGSTNVAAGGMTQVNSIVRKLLNNPSKLDLTAIPDPGVPANQHGYLQLFSAQPIIAWASQINNANNDPSLEIGRRLGYVKLLLPSSTNVGVFRSTLSVLNTQSTSAVVEITFTDTSGILQGSKTLHISANGLFSEDDILTSLGVAGQFGPLIINLSNGVPVIAISRVYSSSGTSAFFETKPID